MSEEIKTERIPIDRRFFCDGHGYLLTSASLGGSGLSAADVSETLFEGGREKCLELLSRGVCFPVGFDGDCALDGHTVFVIGELDEAEEKNWIARLVWKLNIPCGKLILCCGWCEEDLEKAVALEKPDPDYFIYQIIDIPPGEYEVGIYAYFSSTTVQVSLDEYDPKFGLVENEEKAEFYRKNYPGIGETDYIIRLKPLTAEQDMPEFADGWFESFEFRPVEN